MSYENLNNISYTAEKQDFVHFADVYSNRFGMRNHHVRSLIIFFFSAAVLTVINFIKPTIIELPVRVLINIFLIFILIFIVISFSVLPTVIRMKARRDFDNIADYKYPMVVELNNRVLRVSKKYTRVTYNLSGIFACCESRTHFCFFVERYSQNGEFIPKSILTQQQSEAISVMLSDVLGKKYCKV